MESRQKYQIQPQTPDLVKRYLFCLVCKPA